MFSDPDTQPSEEVAVTFTPLCGHDEALLPFLLLLPLLLLVFLLLLPLLLSVVLLAPSQQHGSAASSLTLKQAEGFIEQPKQ